MILSELLTNETAIIVSCPVKRLCDLGLHPGIEIQMIKPGNPCIIRLSNINLGIGREYQIIINIERKDNRNSQNQQ